MEVKAFRSGGEIVKVSHTGSLFLKRKHKIDFVIKWLSFFLPELTGREEDLLVRIVVDRKLDIENILEDKLFVSKRSLDETRRRLEKKGWLTNGKVSPLFGDVKLELKLEIRDEII